MNRRTMLLSAILVFVGVGSAQAGVNPSYKDITDGGCVLNMSTAACFGYSSPTGGANQPPTVTYCYAMGRDGQRCRDCAEAYFNDGTPRGYKVCAYVAYSASCDCTNALTMKCAGRGSCNYIGQSIN